MGHADALAMVETSLSCHPGRRGLDVLQRWARTCPMFAAAGLASTRDVPPWVWSLRPDEANRVLRTLVEHAQAGDAIALVAVVACLRPGLHALSRRTGLGIDELVSDATIEVLRFPVHRRTSVAGQLLLETRQTIWRRSRKVRDLPMANRPLVGGAAPGELGVELSPAEQLVEIVTAAWRAGDLRTDDARLILETRVAGMAVTAAATRRSLSRTATYQRRTRAEARLTRAAGWFAVADAAVRGALPHRNERHANREQRMSPSDQSWGAADTSSPEVLLS